MQSRFALLALSAALMTGCVAPTPPQSPPAAEQISATSTRSDGFDGAINSFRRQSGRDALARSAVLTKVAQAHANDMVKRNYFSHTAPGRANGKKFSDRAHAAGCNIRRGAENLAEGQRSEAEVFEAWKNSPGHKRNMLGKLYTQYGLGRANNTWVLVLAGKC